ncbi:hypothetical protein E2I00_010743, partial [Balaenoptera physalus]
SVRGRIHQADNVLRTSLGDLQVLLFTCCTSKEKSQIPVAAQAHADELAAQNQGHITYLTGGDAIPNQDPHWDYQQEGRGLEHKNHMINCLTEGMKRELTQRKDENPALLQGRLMEAFREYTNINPDTPERQVLPGGPLEGRMPSVWEKSTETLPDRQTRGPLEAGPPPVLKRNWGSQTDDGQED